MFGKSLDVAQYFADMSRAIERITTLEVVQKRMADTFADDITRLKERVSILEAEMRVLRAEVRADVAESVAEKVQAAQRDVSEQLRAVAVELDRVRANRLPPAD